MNDIYKNVGFFGGLFNKMRCLAEKAAKGAGKCVQAMAKIEKKTSPCLQKNEQSVMIYNEKV